MTIEEASEKISGNELMIQLAYDLTEPSDEWQQSASICKTLVEIHGGQAKLDDFMPTHKTEEERYEENMRAMEAWEHHINQGG